MKVRITFELDETRRRAISNVFGDSEPANRERVINYIDMMVDYQLQKLAIAYMEETEEDEKSER